MAIEVIPKQKIKEISWTRIAVYAALALFLAFLFSYFALAFYKQNMERELAELEKALKRTPAQSELEEDILSFQKRANDSAILLARHALPTKIFELLEENTYRNVWLSAVKLDLQGGIIEITGIAANFEILAQQVLIFEKNDLVKKIALSRVSTGRTGEITFEARLTFDTTALK